MPDRHHQQYVSTEQWAHRKEQSAEHVFCYLLLNAQYSQRLALTSNTPCPLAGNRLRRSQNNQEVGNHEGRASGLY